MKLQILLTKKMKWRLLKILKIYCNRTIIFITHKMEILKYMDTVLLIKDNGKYKKKLSKNLIKNVRKLTSHKNSYLKY